MVAHLLECKDLKSNTIKASLHVEEAFKLALIEVSSIDNFDQPIRDEAQKFLVKRLKFCESPVFFLARFLDPREKGESLTEEQILQGIQVLNETILRNSRFELLRDQTLKEVAEWHMKGGVFGHPNRAFT